MELHTKNLLAKGAYALVFRDPEHGRVYKLFKTSAWDKTVTDEDRRRTFSYELAGQHPETVVNVDDAVCSESEQGYRPPTMPSCFPGVMSDPIWKALT
jgi:hypothetical protein